MARGKGGTGLLEEEVKVEGNGHKGERIVNVAIPAPKFSMAKFVITGTAPYVQLAFGQKAINLMKAIHEAGHQRTKGKKREPRNFSKEFESALHKTPEGKFGIPAGAFRKAMISACKIVGFQMTKAKLAVFVEADGFDETEGTPIVFIEGKPEMVIHHVRNSDGSADLRTRGMWRKWSAAVRVKWDADMFSIQDITNLMKRVGMQVGLGEGRPDSKMSAGMGWGLFDVEPVEE